MLLSRRVEDCSEIRRFLTEKNHACVGLCVVTDHHGEDSCNCRHSRIPVRMAISGAESQFGPSPPWGRRSNVLTRRSRD